MKEENIDKVLSFLKGQKLAVISTKHVLKEGMESALIAFVEDADLNLYFQTRSTTRKAINLTTERHTSFVIGFSQDELRTLQYEGLAVQLTDTSEIEACKQMFAGKDSPTRREHLDHPLAVFFKVRPTWISFSDYSAGRPQVIELNNFI